MSDFEAILESLDRLSKRYPLYGGTVERSIDDDLPRLRWFNLREPGIQTKPAVEFNNAAAALDELSTSIIEALENAGVAFPEAHTPGARVMAWILGKDWKPNRVSAFTVGNAFDAIHARLVKESKRIAKEKAKPEEYPGLADLAKSRRSQSRRMIAEAYLQRPEFKRMKAADKPSLGKLMNWLKYRAKELGLEHNSKRPK